MGTLLLFRVLLVQIKVVDLWELKDIQQCKWAKEMITIVSRASFKLSGARNTLNEVTSSLAE